MNTESSGRDFDVSLSVTQLQTLTLEGDRLHNIMSNEVSPSIGQMYRITLGDPHTSFTLAYQHSTLRRAACVAKDYIIVGQYRSYFVKHRDGVLLGMAHPREYVGEGTVWHTVLEYELI